jgi:hypothetical protein
MPNHIFIYRDGVGDSMRQQVINQELEQLNKICQDEYGILADSGQSTDESGKSKYTPPKITLVIVNKRVRQRFF